MAVIAGSTPERQVIMPGQTFNSLTNTLEVPLFIFAEMEDRIDVQINNLWNRTNDIYDEALEAIRDLSSNTLFNIPTQLISDPDFNFLYTVDFDEPDAPLDVDEEDFVLDVSGAPAFEPLSISFNEYDPAPTDNTPAPAISYPPVPGAISEDPPVAPGDPAAVTIPTSPDLTIPAAPTFASFGLPTLADIDFSDLIADVESLYDNRPTMTDLQVNTYLSPLENAASSFYGDVLSNVTGLVAAWEADIQGTKIYTREDEILDIFQSLLDGTRETGLPATVEEQLFDRGRAREDQELRKQEDDILLTWAAKGITLPQGALDFQLDGVRQEAATRKLALNREIIIQQHEKKIEEFWNCVNTVKDLAATRFDLYARMLSLGIELQKNAVDALTNAVAQRAVLLRAQIEIYTSALAVFEQRIRVELAQIDEYRAELEAHKLRAELNENEVRIYEARIRAIQVEAEVFRTRMEAARIELESEGQILRNYEIRVNGYRALVEAKEAEIQGFRAQIEAEVAKTDVYRSQIQAFAERVRAYAASTDALVKQDDLKIRQEEARITAFDAEVRGYQSKVEARARAISALAEALGAEAQIFNAKVNARDADARTQLASLDQQIRVQDILANINIEEARQINENRRFVKELQLQATIAIGQVSGQITAGAMAAMDVSLSAGLSNSQTMQSTMSHGHSESV